MRERAVLAAIETRRGSDSWSAEESLEELAQLAATAGAEVVGKIIQRLPTPNRSYFMGEGKLNQLLSQKESLNYNVVIFDDELSPQQQKNLEDLLKVKIIDRVALILDIFAKRARTREGKLQVELAQMEYLLPRLAGQWSHLERLGGGIGTRGPGESQIETDRRLIQTKIQRYKKQLEQVSKQRDLYRQRRRKTGIPVIAMVGYTNAGKSALFNALSRSAILSEDKLFATLDPTTRRVALPDKTIALLTDTVGFIRKLPPTIVSAFRATLEELEEADVLIHVVDFSSPGAAKHCETVEGILRDMGLTEKPIITALNKIDLMVDANIDWTEEKAIEFLTDNSEQSGVDAVLISAVKKWGMQKLLELVTSALQKTNAAF